MSAGSTPAVPRLGRIWSARPFTTLTPLGFSLLVHAGAVAGLWVARGPGELEAPARLVLVGTPGQWLVSPRESPPDPLGEEGLAMPLLEVPPPPPDPEVMELEDELVPEDDREDAGEGPIEAVLSPVPRPRELRLPRRRMLELTVLEPAVPESPAPATPAPTPLTPPPAEQGEACTEEQDATTMIPLHAPAPPYPTRDLRLGHAGTVVFLVTIDAAGEVCECRIEQSSGFPGLDRAALETILTWKFAPLDESNATRHLRIPVCFRLPAHGRGTSRVPASP